MPLSILIGFTYLSTHRLGALTCAKADIETMRGVLPGQHIVITDDDIKQSSDLDRILSSFSAPDDLRLILYYTGHGLPGNLCLPNGEDYSVSRLRSNVIDRFSNSMEIFVIFDCCMPDGLSLPYYYELNPWNQEQLNTSMMGRFRLVKNTSVSYSCHDIVVLTSSNSDEWSMATKQGSFFTLYLARELSKRQHINLVRLLYILREEINARCGLSMRYSASVQSINIYVSYLRAPMLWEWINLPSQVHSIDESTMTITLSRQLSTQ